MTDIIHCPWCEKPIQFLRAERGAPSGLPAVGVPSTPPTIPKDYATTVPQPSSLASVTDQKLSDDLDALPWVWNSKHSGHLTDWTMIAQQTRAALASRMTPEKHETWRYGQYSYNRFTSDRGTQLLCRFPVKAVETKK